MSAFAVRRPARHAVRVLDTALALWVALWIGLGVWIGVEVAGLTRLSNTVVVAGNAVQQAGAALQAVGQLPLIGSEVRPLAGRVATAGRSAQRSGRASKGDIGTLSVLLAIAVALMPTTPLVALYLPLRRGWARERRAVRRAIDAGDGLALERFLARRALQRLSYDRLRELSDDPWSDLQRDELRSLADAELARLGLEQRARARRPAT
ncbi:MAG: hypothetical protein ACRDMX_13635 [Solirubrobacteraceae bacterium]